MKTRDNQTAKLPLYYVAGGEVTEFTDETHRINGDLLVHVERDGSGWPISGLYATRSVAYDHAIQHWQGILENAEDRLRELRRERG